MFYCEPETKNKLIGDNQMLNINNLQLNDVKLTLEESEKVTGGITPIILQPENPSTSTIRALEEQYDGSWYVIRLPYPAS